MDFEALFGYTPLFLVVFFLCSAWFAVDLTVARMILPALDAENFGSVFGQAKDFVSGVALASVFGFLFVQVVWNLAEIYLLPRRFRYRYWQPELLREARLPDVFQVKLIRADNDPSTQTSAYVMYNREMIRAFNGLGLQDRLPRPCPKGQIMCHTVGERTDRMYHCEELNKCLPVLDHYCWWLHQSVYLPNFKQYLCFLVGLVVYDAYILAMAAYVFSEMTGWMSARTVAIGLVLASSIVVLLWGSSVAFWQWHRNVYNGELFPEKGYIPATDKEYRYRHQMALRLPDRIQSVIVDRPWQLASFWSNAAYVVGPGWSWLMPWVEAPRVKEYYRTGTLRFGPRMERWVEFYNFSADVDSARSSAVDPSGSALSLPVDTVPATGPRRRDNRSSRSSAGYATRQV